MATYRLPLTSDDPHAVVSVDLEGTTYRLRLDWHEREAAWYFSLELQDGTQLLDGRKVVLDWPLLMRVVDARRPPGEIMFRDTSGSGIDPGRNDLGARVIAVYIDGADLAAAVAG